MADPQLLAPQLQRLHEQRLGLAVAALALEQQGQVADTIFRDGRSVVQRRGKVALFTSYWVVCVPKDQQSTDWAGLLTP